MTYETIIYRKASGMATITMNRPQAMNAITPDMLGELKTAVLEAGQDQDVKIIVLTGAGKAFCAGVDLKSLGNRKLINGKVGDILDIPARELIQAICSVPKVVIALVNGFCFTGALEIILGCDIVIASEDAKIGDTHAKWSLRPTWGMSARLPRRVGFLKAKMAKKILSNSEQSIVAYKHLYNTNVSLTLEKSLELEFGSEFVISDTEERLAQFRK
jgi:enoyl-CoA hydratase/carnithine racemase